MVEYQGRHNSPPPHQYITYVIIVIVFVCCWLLLCLFTLHSSYDLQVPYLTSTHITIHHTTQYSSPRNVLKPTYHINNIPHIQHPYLVLVFALYVLYCFLNYSLPSFSSQSITIHHIFRLYNYIHTFNARVEKKGEERRRQKRGGHLLISIPGSRTWIEKDR